MKAPDLSEALPWREELLAYARRQCRTPANAEDVVQDVHLKGWLLQQAGHSDLCEDVDALRRWLFATVRFTSWGYNRKERRMAEQPLDTELVYAERQDKWGLDKDVADVIRSLPERHAEVVRLLVTGYSYRETAERIGRSKDYVYRIFAAVTGGIPHDQNVN